MTSDEIIAGVLHREGGWRDAVERPDGTVDPPTNHGITLDTYRAWSHNVTEVDLRKMSPLTAQAIYSDEYIDKPGFTQANIPYEPLRVQLIDFGINSGQELAVRWLQRVLRMAPEAVDGKLGPVTLYALNAYANLTMVNPDRWYAMVNDALVAARSYMIDRAVDHGRMRKADEEGVESRALDFFLAKP